jgi:hypothetical protein
MCRKRAVRTSNSDGLTPVCVCTIERDGDSICVRARARALTHTHKGRAHTHTQRNMDGSLKSMRTQQGSARSSDAFKALPKARACFPVPRRRRADQSDAASSSSSAASGGGGGGSGLGLALLGDGVEGDGSSSSSLQPGPRRSSCSGAKNRALGCGEKGSKKGENGLYEQVP